MKLKLDENLGEAGRDVLEADGHDVMTVAQQKLSGVADQRIYEICRDERHTLRFPPDATAGIAVLECRGRVSPSAIRSRIAELAAVLRTQSIDGQLWIIEPGRVRMRQRGEG